ncbi:MAG: branched-chain-amino-acid transaminase [Bacillota bacterium]|jgi:branched-chain amino acid aminotransferase
MGLKIYLDGAMVDKKDAKISVFDHGLLYGDGIFEGIRAYDGRIFQLEKHVDRLYEGANVLRIKVPCCKAEMRKIVVETCKANQLTDCYIRLIVTRGVGGLGIDPTGCLSPSVICIADEITLYPDEYYKRGLTLATVPTRRNINEACNVRVKSLNYLNNIYAKMEGQLMNVPEVVFLNNEGYVSEASADNIFCVRKGVLYTPPLYACVLGGITREIVIDLAKAAGIEVREELFTRFDLYTADECFLTGTAADLVPAVVYDGRTIGHGGPGPVYKKLLAAFKELVKTEGTVIK